MMMLAGLFPLAVVLCASANGITKTANNKSRQNAPRIRCVLVVELMFAFTLLALRCVNTFYSKRVKDVETFHLTRIRRQFVVYFCLHRGKCAGKHGGIARLNGSGAVKHFTSYLAALPCRTLVRARGLSFMRKMSECARGESPNSSSLWAVAIALRCAFAPSVAGSEN